MKELIQGFKEGLQGGMDKIASEYGIEEHDRDSFIDAVTAEFEQSITAEGIDKEASYGAAFGSALKGGLGGAATGGALATGVLGLGGAALTGLGALAVKKVGKSFGASSNRAAYDHAFQEALRRSELLQQADPAHVKRMADSIFSFAPTVASDSNVLTNILVNAIHGDSIDLQTIRAVTELEEKLTKMNK